MEKRVIAGKLPAPLAGIPVSQVIKAGDYVFVSGQAGFIDDRGRRIKGIEGQTCQCLESIKKVLADAGTKLSDVVKVNVYLLNINDFQKVNEVYRRYFEKDYPVRTTVGVARLGLPDMLVEIECVAYRP